jgi:hypothetical protein
MDTVALKKQWQKMKPVVVGILISFGIVLLLIIMLVTVTFLQSR